MTKEKQIEEMAKVVKRLAFDLRSNMTPITRYVRHERAKHPKLTDGQFIDRHLEYRELANAAVDNILKCLNDNDGLSKIERMRFDNPDYRKQSEAEWVPCDVLPADEDGEWTSYACSMCKHTTDSYYRDVHDLSRYCPNCGARMKGGAE